MDLSKRDTGPAYLVKQDTHARFFITIRSSNRFTSKLRNDSGLDPRRLWNPQVEENTIVYCWVLRWPYSNKLLLNDASATPRTKAALLGYSGRLLEVSNVADGKGIVLDLSCQLGEAPDRIRLGYQA